jgi:hypothetical protein
VVLVAVAAVEAECPASSERLDQRIYLCTNMGWIGALSDSLLRLNVRSIVELKPAMRSIHTRCLDFTSA